jgi:hypothetical protein
MSRGPGVIERRVLECVTEELCLDALQIAAEVFAMEYTSERYWERDESRLTAAQIGSVRRALRRLAVRGVIERAPMFSHKGRACWRLSATPTRKRRSKSAGKPAAASRPLPSWRTDPSYATAPTIPGNPDNTAPFAASTRLLGLRRNPVQLRRRRRPADQGLY